MIVANSQTNTVRVADHQNRRTATFAEMDRAMRSV